MAEDNGVAEATIKVEVDKEGLAKLVATTSKILEIEKSQSVHLDSHIAKLSNIDDSFLKINQKFFFLNEEINKLSMSI